MLKLAGIIGPLLGAVALLITQTLTLNPGDSVVVNCSTSLTSTVKSPQQWVIACSTPTPTAVATQTPTPVPPTRTPTPIPPTPTGAPSTSTFFKVGAGFSDVSPHQIVRTRDDKLYLFGSQEYTGLIRAFIANGLPNSTADFGMVSVTASANVISLDAVYDNQSTIHVIAMLQNSQVVDYPFSTATNAFSAPTILATNGRTIAGNYMGSEGVAGTFDRNGALQVVYQSNADHIIFRSTNTQLDAGTAQHPAIATAPDGSIVVAWLQTDAKIYARTFNGSWGAIETVSAAPAFNSTSGGLSIDQGPSLVIDANGVRHLAYIENWRITAPYDYGRIHYVRNSGSGWQDVYTGAYTHNPAIALNSTGDLYIFGHGYSLNAACTSADDLCYQKRNADGSWTVPQIFATHPTGTSFDSSVSIKWSGTAWYRSGTMEFVFFDINANPSVLWYGRK